MTLAPSPVELSTVGALPSRTSSASSADKPASSAKQLGILAEAISGGAGIAVLAVVVVAAELVPEEGVRELPIIGLVSLGYYYPIF